MPRSTPTTRSCPNLPFLDITAPGFTWEDPAVAAAREQCWAARTPIGLLVLRYAEATELARDPRLTSNLRGILNRAQTADGPVPGLFTTTLLSRNGADHRRLRALVTQAFAPRRITALHPFIRTTAQHLAANLAGTPAGDFVELFADPLTLRVLFRILGIPDQDHGIIRRWSNDAFLAISLDHDPAPLPRVTEASLELHHYIDTLIRKRTATPDSGDSDVISALLRARQHHAVSEEELLALLADLVAAGHSTTSHQLALAMVAFARHPEQWQLLRQHPELAGQAVDEVLRFCPTGPVIAWRTAAEDINDYHHLHIPAGTPLWPCVHSAHRDPRAFTTPDTFDITIHRQAPLLAFGAGPHYCLGAALARAELTEALTALTSRLGPPQIAGPITWRPPIGITGPDTLPRHPPPLLHPGMTPPVW